MGLYSFLRGIVDRFKMACLYQDHVIRLSEGIEEGGVITEAIRTKWQMESNKQLQELLDKKGRELKAQRAQQAYAEGLEPLEAFREPDLVEPVPINEAAMTPHELKQIQVDLTELQKHLGNHWETTGRGVPKHHILQ